MFLHIDIDCFFVSAHRSVDESLKHKPVAVGGRSNLEIFNRDRTNIKLMNSNSGAFVTPVFYSEREKTFENFFVDDQKRVRGILVTSSYNSSRF